jgi:flagellar basal body-associated protein FliL
MSDEQQDLNLEDVGAGAEEAGTPRRGGLLSGMLLNILKYAAFAVAGIILVVGTTFITVKALNKGNDSQGLAAISPEYSAKALPLAYYDNIDQIRGQTADDTPAVYLLRVSIGYDDADKNVPVEIGRRAREIQDLMMGYISSRTASELTSAHWDEIKADLTNQINQLMTTGKIKSVAFREFTVVK